MQAVMKLVAIVATGLVSLGAPLVAPAQTKSSVPPITIYHIEGTRAERIVWLAEELGIPYKLEFKPGDRAASMQKIREVNPMMPMSPTVQYGDQLLVESGAIAELLLARHGNGRLRPAVESPDFPYYLQWMHFSEGSLAARLFSDYRVKMMQDGKQPQNAPRMVGSSDVLKFADAFLAKHQYFGGKEFSAADIMMLFPIAYSETLKMAELKDYPNIVEWRKRVESRPAFQRMVKAARPATPAG